MTKRTPSAGGLVYVGDGEFIPGVPARDLTPEEVERYRERIGASPLYQSEAASASAVNEKADEKE